MYLTVTVTKDGEEMFREIVHVEEDEDGIESPVVQALRLAQIRAHQEGK